MSIFLANEEYMAQIAIQSTIGRPKAPYHREPGLLSGILLFVFISKEFLKNLFYILRLRKKYHNLKENSEDPHVVVFSDNLDETNGIAINSRFVQKEMKRVGRNFQLMGVAFHTHDTGLIEEGGTILVPQVYSMEQLGYKESETAIPELKAILDYFDENQVDLIELETPSSACSMVLVLARLIGIKPISHYRTDVFFYVDQLIDNAMARWFVKTWVRTFCTFSRPIIVPSNDFKTILPKEMNLPKEEFVRIDRGIHLEQFNPTKTNNLWPQSSIEVNTRFLFVGRISQEKEIDFLVECFNRYVEDGGLGELIFVGQGPYLEDLKNLTKDQKRIRCVGKKMGDDLAAFYAEADYFLFPSGSDTFGNVVVEALASGTPAFVSDRGGPKDIVAAEKTGSIIPFKDKEKWIEAFFDAQKLKQTDEYEEWKKASEKHSQSFSLERSANHFWDFYKKVLEKNAKKK